jgi:flagellar biosynthesis protein
MAKIPPNKAKHSNQSKQNKQPKQKSAVGIKYQQGVKGEAPKVIAKGFGELADEIVALAKQSGILIHEDPYLSDFLATLDLGQEIPDQLYHVIAELIAFSYVLQGKIPDSWAKSHGKISKTV